MRSFLGIVGTVVVVLAVSWVTIYSTNRAVICKQPIDKVKAKKYWRCYPGFYFPKNTILDGYRGVLDAGIQQALDNPSDKY